MIVQAYNYAADDGECPREIELLRHIERFGVEAVLGKRVIGAKEARRMTYLNNVVTAYHSRESFRDREGKPNWSEWAGAYPFYNRVLIAAEKAVEELENGE